MILAECNNAHLLWMPGHKGVEGNEIAEQLAKWAHCTHFKFPVPACE
jgi:ribonuclease HI